LRLLLGCNLVEDDFSFVAGMQTAEDRELFDRLVLVDSWGDMLVQERDFAIRIGNDASRLCLL
jgi:hypothetical protein